MISGYTISRDCIAHDYCIEECVRSMLQFCDEVVVGDAMSKDGTRELVADIDPRVRIVDYPRHENLNNARDFVVRWMNATRDHLRGDYQFYLDADEVVGLRGIGDLIDAREKGAALEVNRLNFWGGTEGTVADGEICGKWVIRSGRASMWMPMDCPNLHPRDKEAYQSFQRSGIEVFHYGFLRRPEAFFRKSKFFQRALVGDYDPRLTQAESDGVPWHSRIALQRPLDPFSGSHPSVAIPWLRARGYNPRSPANRP